MFYVNLLKLFLTFSADWGMKQAEDELKVSELQYN